MLGREAVGVNVFAGDTMPPQQRDRAVDHRRWAAQIGMSVWLDQGGYFLGHQTALAGPGCVGSGGRQDRNEAEHSLPVAGEVADFFQRVEITLRPGAKEERRRARLAGGDRFVKDSQKRR